MKLKDKVVLVTGSSIGIGCETAKAFAEKGAIVIVTYNKSKKSADKTLKECQKKSDACLIQLDVSKETSIKKTVKKVIDKFGRLDIIVNNAGVLAWKPFIKHSSKEIDWQINVNLTGLIKMTHYALPYLQKQKEAMIINISSIGGIDAFANAVVYCSTKFGVRGFTQGLALELPKHIKVFTVFPGPTATEMNDFEGPHPRKVADIVVRTAEEKLRKKSGGDIVVPDYL